MEAFGMSEYPVLFRYADDLPKGTLFPPEGARTCLFALLAKTRTEGLPVALSPSHHGCPGGGYYLGFLDTPREGIEYFLSCGIPGKMEGERYIKTPELARARVAQSPVRPEGGDGSFRPFGPSLRGEEPADLRRAVRAVRKDGGKHPRELPHHEDVGDHPEEDPGIGVRPGRSGEQRGGSS